jgi:Ca-activated chloride channel homolog
MRFEYPFVLWFLLAVPLALAWSVLVRRSAMGFSTVDRAARIPSGWRERTVWVPVVLRSLALALLIVGAARPQLGEGKQRTVTKGVAIMMVMDRSTSMQAYMRYEDDRVRRLDGVKQVFRDFVLGNMDRGGDLPGREGDLIGLIGFGRFAETFSPLVREYAALAEATDRVDYAATRGVDAGTAVGDALALAAARLRSAEEQLTRYGDAGGTQPGDPEFEIASKVIILLTDGEENAGDRSALEGAALAKRWGIKVYTIGLGSEFGRGMFGSSTLRRVADLTGGKHFDTTDGDGLSDVYAEIDRLEPTEIERVEYASYREWFGLFAVTALVLVLLDSVLSWAIFRRAV